MQIRIFYFSVIFSVLMYDGLAQYAPISTLASVSTFTSTATVPITVSNFVNIANCLLEIHYNPAIATVTSITSVPALGGSFFPNFSTPGIMTLSWFTFPGVTLPDNTIIFNIVFSKVAFGTTPVTWYDDGFSCLWGDGNYVDLIDVPTSNYYIDGSVIFQSLNAPVTILPEPEACDGALTEVPVKVTSFTNIGKLNLTLQFDAGVLIFQSWNNVSGFPGLAVNASVPGTLQITGTVPSGNLGISLPDSAILLNLQFFHATGSSGLNWIDGGSSCQYSGPPPVFQVLNDIPQNQYYVNGYVTGLQPPAPAGGITGPAGGNVCPGQTGIAFSILPVSNAVSYNWSFPIGFNITAGMGTNMVIVSSGINPLSGDVSVYAMNACGNGLASPAFPVIVNTPPSILSQPSSSAPVMAGAGSASFMVIADGSQIVFQWQEFVTSWNDISNSSTYSGATSPTLTIHNPPLAMNGNRYRCVVHGFCTPVAVTDGTAILTVTPVIGMNEQQSESESLTVFPNPLSACSVISFRVADGTWIDLVVSNNLGEHLFRKQEIVTGGGKFLMPVPDCITGNGVYYICVRASKDGITSQFTKKIVVHD